MKECFIFQIKKGYCDKITVLTNSKRLEIATNFLTKYMLDNLAKFCWRIFLLMQREEQFGLNSVSFSATVPNDLDRIIQLNWIIWSSYYYYAMTINVLYWALFLLTMRFKRQTIFLIVVIKLNHCLCDGDELAVLAGLSVLWALSGQNSGQRKSLRRTLLLCVAALRNASSGKFFCKTLEVRNIWRNY